MAQLRLETLTKSFGPVRAVEDLSLEVESGELVALVGPSGCGKTTTLRLIAGFERPDRGDIQLDGRSLLPLPPEERGVGIVFQNYALFPHMNVFDNVAYGLKFRRPKPAIDPQARVRELLERMDLRGLERRKPAELSAGQQQRVALARALAPEPRVLLLDEPLSALDVQLRVRLRLELKRLQRRLNITTLYVTHDQEEALAIADRVAVMNGGRLEQVGPPWEVYHRPRTPFVAGFVGRGNLVEGEIVSREGDRARLALRDGQSVVLHGDPHGSKPGDRVLFLVRPEKLVLNPSTSTSPSMNRLKGRIAGVEYLGGSALLHIECAGKIWLLQRSSPQPDELRREGQEVVFGFAPEDAVFIPPDSEGAGTEPPARSSAPTLLGWARSSRARRLPGSG